MTCLRWGYEGQRIARFGASYNSNSARLGTPQKPSVFSLSVLQQYRVINLWELDAERVLAAGMPTLLPFVPIMRGGDRIDIVQRAVYALRRAPDLVDFATFLAIIASYVLDRATIRSIMRPSSMHLRCMWWLPTSTRNWREGASSPVTTGVVPAARVVP
jgi:hypothetical protein